MKKVKIDGELARIHAGDGDDGAPALKALSAATLGSSRNVFAVFPDPNDAVPERDYQIDPLSSLGSHLRF